MRGPTLVIRTNQIEPLINYKYDKYGKKMDSVSDEFKLNKIGLEVFKRRLFTCLIDNPVEFFTKFVKLNIICAWSHDCDILLWTSRSKFFSGKNNNVTAPISKGVLNKLYVLTNAFFLYISMLAFLGTIKMRATPIIADRYLVILFSYFVLNFILLGLYNGTARYHFDSMVILFIFSGYAVSCFSNESR